MQVNIALLTVTDTRTIKTDKSGNPIPATSDKYYEQIPLDQNIDKYFEKEVKPHLPESWIDRSKDKIGYEIFFSKYFFKFSPLRSTKEVNQDLIKINNEIQQLSKEVIND